MDNSLSGFRARMHSEPELPQLLPVPVRPHSSYETRPVGQEFMQFSPDVIDALTQTLGLETSSPFTWVVRDCLLKLKEEGWSVSLTPAGDLNYVHVVTEEIRSSHATVQMHQQLAQRLLVEHLELSHKRNDRLYLAKEIIFRHIHSVSDVRQAASPRVLERLLDLLGVDVRNEPFLVSRVICALQEAWLSTATSRGGPQTVGGAVNVVELLTQLAIDRSGYMRKVSPSGLLYCVECETALADGICASCHDCLCNSCFVATHSTGHRLDHLFVLNEQCVCSECEVAAAIVRCTDCADLYCLQCFNQQHAHGKSAKHGVKLPNTTYCFECDNHEAAYVCVECQDALCHECSAAIHRKGARQNHTLFGIKKAAYNKKLFAQNVHTLVNILERNIAANYSLSAWFMFYDEALNPFWYNVATKAVQRTTMRDLITRPLESPEEIQETNERCARLASQGAVFAVPPPMHIKFASQNSKPNAASASLTGSSSKSLFGKVRSVAGSTGQLAGPSKNPFTLVPATPEIPKY